MNTRWSEPSDTRGKVYQNEMARAVQESGYAIRQTTQNGEITGFEIEGVSDSLCERFSKRREEIERQIEKFEEKQGRKPTVKEIALITRETRPAELKGDCHCRSSRLSAFPIVARGMETIAGPSFARRKRKLCRFKLVMSVRRFAPVSRISLSGAASCANTRFWPKLSTSRSDRWIWSRLKQAASNAESGLVRLTDSPENRLLSECCTRQGLQLEQRAVKYVNDTKNTCPSLNSRFVPAAHLSQEQKEAVASILSTRDRVFSFRGVAGAGKTTTLKECNAD